MKMEDRTGRCLDARLNANTALRSWGVDVGINYEVLRRLVGYLPDSDDYWEDSFTEEHLLLCEALAGPHGYAVYKMLLIKGECWLSLLSKEGFT